MVRVRTKTIEVYRTVGSPYLYGNGAGLPAHSVFLNLLGYYHLFSVVRLFDFTTFSRIFISILQLGRTKSHQEPSGKPSGTGKTT